MRAIRLALALILLLAGLAMPAPVVAQILPGIGGTPAAEAEAPAQPDPAALLLQVLRDDAARARLIEQLEAAGTAPDAAPAEAPKPRVSLGHRLADYTGAAAERTLAWGRGLRDDVLRAPRALAGLDGDAFRILWEAARDLILIIVVTAGTFTALRILAIPFYRRLGRHAAGRPIRQRVVPFLIAGAVDFAIVLVAWLVGNGVALLVFGEQGHVAVMQVLYLTAFLAVELVKAAFRLVLSPATAELRPVNLSDWAATRFYRVIRILASLLGYGFLLVLPIVADETGFVETRSMATLVWLLGILFAIWVVLTYRREVGDWLLAQLDRTPSGAAADPVTAEPLVPEEPEGAAAAGQPEERLAETLPPEGGAVTRQSTNDRLRALAHGWHWLAFAWLGWLLLTVFKQRPGAVAELLESSGRVALALVFAFAMSGLLGRWIHGGISLPHRLREQVPLLESRLNNYVPWFLLVFRLLIVIGVLLYAARTLGLLPSSPWIEQVVGPQIARKVVGVVAILSVGFFVWLAMASWVEYRLNANSGRVPSAREQTLLTLLRNAATIVILALALMFVLSEIGVNIGPLIASAGVVGLAIGFGAQKMVQDIITGIFIQFENAINVGDVVSAGGISGAVERITVRSVSLRTVDGTYHIIPFSSVDVVSNSTRDFAFHVHDMRVAYREELGEVKQAMLDAFEELRFDPEQGGFILGDAEWFGINAFSENAMLVRVRIKTWPGKQWGVGRAYNEIVKRIFDERDIEIPFPQQTVWTGVDKHGAVPSIRVTSLDADAGPGFAEPTQDLPPDDDGR